jgi:hypothetical protein
MTRRPAGEGRYTHQDPALSPACAFSMELDKGSRILDCRHSLVLILNRTQLKVLVWEPVTGDVSRVAFSRGYVSIAIVGQLPA